MRLNANKRAAALEEEEGPRKRHASPDEVLNDKEALKRYLERTEQSLECMQREHSILKRSHQNLQEVVSDLQDEAIKVSLIRVLRLTLCADLD